MLLLKIVNVERLLEDNAAGIAAIKITTPVIQVTNLRDLFLFAVPAATSISYKLNDDVNVANKNNNKNREKNNSPNGSCEKIDGKTINNNPGPSAGSNPKAKTTGNIASPANSETNIFKLTTVLADDVRLISFFKYELYVTIQENPTAREKNDCPSAYNIDWPVIFEKSGDKKNFTPSIAPSSVNARTTSIIKNINRKGIIYLLALSMPF